MDPVYAVLESVAKAVNKRHDLEVAVPGRLGVKADVSRWIETASPLLNCLLGEANYGCPVGRIIELFGDYSHGKSTIAQIIMNAFQKSGGISVLLDSESGWNRERALSMGHDADRHLAVEVDTCEMGFGVIYSTIQEFKVKLGGEVPVVFVWDTIAASPTDGEKKGAEYDSGMMWKPRLIRRELKRLASELKSINATLIFVNQTIEGPKPNRTGIKTTPGGGGIKFWSSQRLQVYKVGMFGEFVDKKKHAGIITEVKMVKNKLAAPFKKVDIPLDFSCGANPLREVTNYHLDNTAIYNIAGARRSIVGFKDEILSAYEKDIPALFDKHEGLLDWMIEQLRMHWVTGETL